MTLVIEIMGRYSNIILVDENGKIIDALKRVDAEMSSERLVLPGITYCMPPAQNKISLLDAEVGQVVEAIEKLPKAMELSKALLSVLQGVSPVVCREIQYLTGKGRDVINTDMNEETKERLTFFLRRLKEKVISVSGKPYLAADLSQKPMDFSFLRIEQYGLSAIVRECGSFSQLLDDFYGERDRRERMHVREQDLLRVLSTVSERLCRKINAQKAELEECANRDTLRLYGDLISANLYQIEPRSSFVELQNFYEETSPTIRIKLDPLISPSQTHRNTIRSTEKLKQRKRN